MRRAFSFVGCLALFMAGGLHAAPPANAAGTTAIDPPVADSLWMTSREVPRPVWEKILDAPYRIVKLPFRAGAEAIKGGVILVDRLGGVPSFLTPMIGDYRIGYGVSAGGVSGAGFSVRADREVRSEAATRVRLRLGMARSGTRRLTAGILKPLDPGGHRALEIGGGLRTEAGARYHGLGPASTSAQRSYYREEVIWEGVAFRQSLGSNAGMQVQGIFSGIEARRPGTDEGLPLATVFAGNLPAGYGRRSTGTTVALSLEHDTTVETGRPERGGIRKLTAGWFIPSDGTSTDFTSTRMELQEFLPLWHSKRVLALRAHVTKLHRAGEDPIPFQRLLTNDDPDLLRGDQDYRWRDEGLLGLSAEYRWPVWAFSRADGAGLDGYLFAETGQVFHQREDLSFATMRESYGVGLRLVTAAGFSGRAEFAWGEDDPIGRLRGDQVFQYAKAGLYFGRNPFPIR